MELLYYTSKGHNCAFLINQEEIITYLIFNFISLSHEPLSSRIMVYTTVLLFLLEIDNNL